MSEKRPGENIVLYVAICVTHPRVLPPGTTFYYAIAEQNAAPWEREPYLAHRLWYKTGTRAACIR
jgi:hypothetical protein